MRHPKSAHARGRKLSAVDATVRPRQRAQKGTFHDRATTSPSHPLDYIEIPVVDVATAKEFYGSPLGWTFTDYGPDYAGIQDPARAAEVGGLANPDWVRPGGLLVLLFSDDLDASVKAVTPIQAEAL